MMQHFLLIYDHNAQALRDARPFAEDQCDQAAAAYEAAELEHGDDRNIEIVLVGADSLETIKRTHGHYFEGTDRLAKYLQPSRS
jgi:hypothetical protein